jgi:hypothetical protein
MVSEEYDESAEHSESTGRSGPFDFVRRMAAAGLGAVFLSEEGLRKLASQLKLPKEALGLLLNQAEKAKDDIGRLLSDEVRRFLQSDRLRDEFLKLLAGMTLEVKAEVRLVPDGVKDKVGGLLPKVKIQELRTSLHEREEGRPREKSKKRKQS